MAYNKKQYDAALDFLATGDDNVVDPWDKKRIQSYDLYENLYINSTFSLKLILRGTDQVPILMPSGKKIIEAITRFLGVNVDFLVEGEGDQGARDEVQKWWEDFFKREGFVSKFSSNKRWGLVRGDAAFYVYAKTNKVAGKRICIEELDPRNLFEIEDAEGDVVGIYIVDQLQDFREPDKPDKKIARRRKFMKLPAGADDEEVTTIGITSELRFYEIGEWDERDPNNTITRIPWPDHDEDEYKLPDSITQLPVYKWRTRPPQNSTWGHSALTGLETLMYAINQSLSDEDCSIVFQGLGMYVTTAGPPRDPNTNEVTAWNIGPKQIIEIGAEQTFERVTGIDSLQPFQDHMNFIDEKGLSESSGTPEVAIGRVDVAVAESGISLQLQMMPLIAGNAELELEMINVLDQMFHDITTMWLPGYESEMFGNVDAMTPLSVVVLFDNPMPKNRDAEVNETILLDQSGLILKTMAIAKLRSLGWEYPAVDPLTGALLTDDDIAAMLLDQSASQAAAQDPFGAAAASGFDANGNPIPPDQGNQVPNTPSNQTVNLGITQ